MNKKNIKICVIIGVILIIIVLFSILNYSNSPTGILINDYKIPQYEAMEIVDIIDDCGYNKYYHNYKLVKSINNTDIPGSIGFEITSSGKTVGFVDIKDNKVVLVQYSDKYLYQNGVIQHTLSEYILSSSEKSDWIYKTQNTINTILKSPSTADYPWNYDEWKVSKNEGVVIVQSYVDAQNSFGAITRSVFQVTFTDNIITSLIFDGHEYM